MIRYAITDGARFGADAEARLAGLMEDARRWAALGVDYVQLREKTLGAGELLKLATALVEAIRESGGGTKLLVSGRVDVALAARADGVHLTAAAEELTAEQVRRLMPGGIVSASCHSVEEVARAAAGGVDLILFGPVFGKSCRGVRVSVAVGLAALREACSAAGEVGVLALGGVDERNAVGCVEAGAAGVAGIRLFGQAAGAGDS